mgnify:FL=1|tara:strand:- start:135 stop:356 length:222 start_codon:yes stop_codon:yes gene_type:complete
MIYFIFIISTLIFGLVIYLLLKKRKKKTMKSINSDKQIMEDLRYLRKQLLRETNPNVRLEIMKKIEIISSFYN